MIEKMPIFQPYRMGPFELRHRVIMSPMGRNRAGPRDAPLPAAATYYAQRASAGFIVSESTKVSSQGVGHPRTPGIHLPEQIVGWRRVVETVHAEDCYIFLQLTHVGRMSHRCQQKGGLQPIGASPIRPTGRGLTYEGLKSYETPRPLRTDEVPDLVEQFRQGAKNAKEAGFDGVELLGGGGWLLDQFHRDGTNQRTDAYGGSVENRARLPLEATQAAVDVFGADRVGYNITPFSGHNDMSDSNTEETYLYFAQEMNRIGIAFLNISDGGMYDKEAPDIDAFYDDDPPDDWGAAEFLADRNPLLLRMREIFTGTTILNSNYVRDNGNAAIASGQGDLIGIARWWISNPDLVERFKHSARPAQWIGARFYGGDDSGYTDYPYLEEELAEADAS